MPAITPPDLDAIDRIIQSALVEDVGKGDVTTRLLIEPGLTARLRFTARDRLVSCGAGLIPRVFHALDPDIQAEVMARDGASIQSCAMLLEVSGPAAPILSPERTALNLLQRMCSVATLTAQYVEAIKGTKAKIYDTRKTMPGLRELDKYGVRAGGGENHRMRLDDAILIKDNHIALSGGTVAAAVAKVQAGNKDKLPVIVECDTIEQVREALQTEANIILLDNMDLATMREAVALSNGRVALEASGNVTLETVRAIAETGVDRISVGRITHSAPNVDIGLDISIY